MPACFEVNELMLSFCQQDQQLQDLSPKSVLTYGQELPQMQAVFNKLCQYIICIEKKLGIFFTPVLILHTIT